MAKKRPTPSVFLSGASMVPDIQLGADHAEAILKCLPLADPNEATSAIAEVEQILADLQVERARVPEAKKAFGQLNSLSEAASRLHLELGSLGSIARETLLDEAQKSGSIPDLQELSRSVFWLSSYARRAAEPIRPVRGHPESWPERVAIAELLGLWERRTGKRATWANISDDGGPFARFVEVVSPNLSDRQVRMVLEARARKPEPNE